MRCSDLASIAEISEGVEAQKEDIERAKRGDEEEKALKIAIEERENTLLAMQAMEQQGQLMEQKMLEIEAQKRDLEEQMLELKQSKLVEIPLIKHALGLYANITNLRWQYEADSIKGTIVKADDVKSFDYPKDADAVEVRHPPFFFSSSVLTFRYRLPIRSGDKCKSKSSFISRACHSTENCHSFRTHTCPKPPHNFR